MSGSNCKERRQKLICEFQKLLDCMDASACPPPPCVPCMSQMVCLPSENREHKSRDEHVSAQVLAKRAANRKRQQEMENMPLITASSVLEIRPTSNLRNLELVQPGIKYVDIREHTKNKREEEKAKRRECSSSGKSNTRERCYSMVTVCDSCQPGRSQTFLCPVPCPDRSRSATNTSCTAMCPVPSTQYVCYPCPSSPFPRDHSRAKDKPLPPWHKDRYKSRELKGGILLTGCDCTKRNGLQHDCRRSDCQGRPPCLLRPDPDCLPSGGTGLRGAEPRVSKYPYKQAECRPNPERERGPPKKDPCHRAAVDCDRCDPTVLMCRPGECPSSGSQSNMYECRPKRRSSESNMYECRPKESRSSCGQEKRYECRPKESRSSCGQEKRYECRPRESRSACGQERMYECRPKESQSSCGPERQMFECRPKKSQSSHCKPLKQATHSQMYECGPEKRATHSKLYECGAIRDTSHSNLFQCGPEKRSSHTKCYQDEKEKRSTHSNMYKCGPEKRTTHTKLFEDEKEKRSTHSKLYKCGPEKRASHSKLFECKPQCGSSQSNMYECRPKESSPNMYECRPQNRSSQSNMYECRPDNRSSQSNMYQCRPQNRSSQSNMYECRPQNRSSQSNMYECRPQNRSSNSRDDMRRSAIDPTHMCPTNVYPRPDYCPPKYNDQGQENCRPSHPQPVQRTVALQCRDNRSGSSSRCPDSRCPDPRCPVDPRCPTNPCCPPYCEAPTHILKRPSYAKLPPPPVSGCDVSCYPMCPPEKSGEEHRYKAPPRNKVDDWKCAYPCPEKCQPDCVMCYGDPCKWHKKARPLLRFTHAELMSQW